MSFVELFLFDENTVIKNTDINKKLIKNNNLKINIVKNNDFIYNKFYSNNEKTLNKLIEKDVFSKIDNTFFFT